MNKITNQQLDEAESAFDEGKSSMSRAVTLLTAAFRSKVDDNSNKSPVSKPSNTLLGMSPALSMKL